MVLEFSISGCGSRAGYGIGLIESLFLLGMQARTGELSLESGNNIGTLLFHEGRILLAFSPYTRAIGDLLVEQGVLRDTELLEVLKQQRTGPHVPVGALLLRSGKVAFREIEAMVHDQIRAAVKDFRSWSPVDLSFAEKEIRPFDSISLPVYEFIPSSVRKSAELFVAGMVHAIGSQIASE